jgi:G3E family GTPase
VNFVGYEDRSYTAKLQAQYTDLIVMNKSELVSEDQYDLVLDRVNDLNTETPKIKFNKDDGFSPDLVFGLDTKLFMDGGSPEQNVNHHFNEVDLIQIVVDVSKEKECECNVAGHLHPLPIPWTLITKEAFEILLNSLDKEDVFRVKGFIRLSLDDYGGQDDLWILNWAFGRFTLDRVEVDRKGLDIRMTVMGHLSNGIVAVFSEKLGVERACIEFINRGNKA